MDRRAFGRAAATLLGGFLLSRTIDDTEEGNGYTRQEEPSTDWGTFRWYEDDSCTDRVLWCASEGAETATYTVTFT